MFEKICGGLGFVGGSTTYWTIGRIAIVGINGIGTAITIPAIVVGGTSAIAIGATSYTTAKGVKWVYNNI